MNDRLALIDQRLRTAFAPEDLRIDDESAAHVGHEGARAGGGHFKVLIVANAFAKKTPLERHRMVFAALRDLMQREIHALSITALTPEEL